MANGNLQAGSKRLEKLYYAVFTLQDWQQRDGFFRLISHLRRA